MNKKLFAAATAVAMLFFTSSANASEEENVDTLPPPSQELIEQNPWVESSIAPEGQVPSGQDEPEVWAVVDSNGNTLNTIVCDSDYCGSGWIPVAYDGATPTEWARVVLQSQRNPETGNYGGGHWGQYNFSTETWTQTDENGSVYQIPTEYGTESFCIQNCPVVEPEATEMDEEIVIAENNFENDISVTERTIVTKPKFIKNNLVVNMKIRGKVFKNAVTIIATKGNKKMLWNKRIRGGTLNLKIPKKYSSWKISVSYRVL